MEKRVFWAITLSLLVLIFYPYLISKFFPQYLSPEKPSLEGLKKKTSSPSLFTLPSSLPQKEEVFEEFENRNYHITFTNYGGAIKKVELKRYKINNQHLFLVHSEKGKGNLGGLSSKILEFDDARVVYSLEKKEKDRVVYVANLGEQLRIRKEYLFSPESYSIQLHLTIENLSSSLQRFTPALIFSTPVQKERLNQRFVALCLANSKLSRIPLFRLVKKGWREDKEFRWVGIERRYFAILLKAFNPSSLPLKIKGVNAYLFPASPEKERILVIEAKTEPFVLPAHQKVMRRFTFYLGPKSYQELSKVDEDFSSVISYGLFSGIGKILLGFLKFFYRIVHNYGVAVVLLALLVNILLQPLSLRGFKAMKDMQRIQPHLARIREEHKDNQQKVLEETRNLLRKHKINPMGGCFPFLLQIPIFIALYQTLLRSLELRGARFILWIKDLSQPDSFPLPFSLPLLGERINLLPILMAIAMGWQQRISTSFHEKREETERYQQGVGMLMPAIFALIFYNMPSGLVLYWLTNTLISIFYQHQVMKK